MSSVALDIIPAARLISVNQHKEVASAARDMLLSQLTELPLTHAGAWTRDELYEDEA